MHVRLESCFNTVQEIMILHRNTSAQQYAKYTYVLCVCGMKVNRFKPAKLEWKENIFMAIDNKENMSKVSWEYKVVEL